VASFPGVVGATLAHAAQRRRFSDAKREIRRERGLRATNRAPPDLTGFAPQIGRLIDAEQASTPVIVDFVSMFR
jgi:hypothetical protein